MAFKISHLIFIIIDYTTFWKLGLKRQLNILILIKAKILLMHIMPIFAVIKGFGIF